jgi:hypothetical protein
MFGSKNFGGIALALAGSLGLAQAAVAAPSVQLTSGNTTVVLSTDLLNALAAYGVAPENVLPGGLLPTSGGANVVFPIPTGEVDAGSALKLEIIHSGGLTLTAGDTRVALTSFIIENIGASGRLRLTGLVKANDTIVGRIPLFNVALTQAPSVTAETSSTPGILKVRHANLTLTSIAASTLNSVFGLNDVFTSGFKIGTARIYARFRDLDG